MRLRGLAIGEPRGRELINNIRPDEDNPRRIVGAPRLHLPLGVQGQLFSEEQILSDELRM